MRNVLTRGHAILVRVLLVAVGVQFFAAGLGVFGAAGFQMHQTLGRAIVVIALLVFLAALGARPGVMRIGLSALLVVLTVLQFVLAHSPSVIAALHPVNAIVILIVTLRLIGREAIPGLWERTPRTAAPSGNLR